jgi:uncharacterized small protein (DUF1192 family)
MTNAKKVWTHDDCAPDAESTKEAYHRITGEPFAREDAVSATDHGDADEYLMQNGYRVVFSYPGASCIYAPESATPSPDAGAGTRLCADPKCGHAERWHPFDGPCEIDPHRLGSRPCTCQHFVAPVSPPSALEVETDERIVKCAARLKALDDAPSFSQQAQKAESAFRFMAISDVRYLLGRVAALTSEHARLTAEIARLEEVVLRADGLAFAAHTAIQGKGPLNAKQHLELLKGAWGRYCAARSPQQREGGNDGR